MTDKEHQEHTKLIFDLYATRASLIDAIFDIRMLSEQMEILQGFINDMIKSELEFSESKPGYQKFFDDFFEFMTNSIQTKENV